MAWLAAIMWLLGACAAPPDPTPTQPLPTLAVTQTATTLPTRLPTRLPTLLPATATPTQEAALVLIEPTDSAETNLHLPLIEQPPPPTNTPEIKAVEVIATAVPATPEPAATPLPPCLDPVGPPPEQHAPLVGLHASADPIISHLERCTFLELRPSLIKILTFHPPPDIDLLLRSQPDAHWIVRAFLEFGGRHISAEAFVRFTLSDTERTLALLSGRPLVVELHNEPNLVAEGYQSTWQNGTEFAAWWLQILEQYRMALPNARFIYPGLSPGNDINGVRTGHLDFLEQSRVAVEAADGLGVHLYWGRGGSMDDALATLDEIIGRFPNTPIWITEASYNNDDIDDSQRAAEYLKFVDALQARETVQGVTFFVASASNPDFAPETWVGKEIAKILGTRIQD